MKLSTISSTTFGPTDTIVIQMPEAMVDFTAFDLFGTVSTAGGQAHGVYLGGPIESLIDSISIECGGVSIQNGFSLYNDLHDIYRRYTAWDKKPFRQILQVDNHPLATASNYTCSNVPFAITSWLGALGSIKTLDLTLLPPMKIYIRLANTDVLTVHAGNAATRTFTLNNVYAMVDILDVADGVLYPLVQSKLAQSAIEVPFTQYATITGGQGPITSTTRWSTSADCLTRVLGTFKPSGYNSNTVNSSLGSSDYFTKGGKDTGVTLTSSTFSVNGIRYPTTPATIPEVCVQTANVLGVSQDVLGATDSNGMRDLATWSSNCFLHANSFTYDDGSDPNRLVGLSARGSQLLGTFELQGTGGSNVLPVVWLEMKSLLRIGHGRSIELVL